MLSKNVFVIYQKYFYGIKHFFSKDQSPWFYTKTKSRGFNYNLSLKEVCPSIFCHQNAVKIGNSIKYSSRGSKKTSLKSQYI